MPLFKKKKVETKEDIGEDESLEEEVTEEEVVVKPKVIYDSPQYQEYLEKEKLRLEEQIEEIRRIRAAKTKTPISGGSLDDRWKTDMEEAVVQLQKYVKQLWQERLVK